MKKLNLILVFLVILSSISMTFAEESYYIQVGAFEHNNNAQSHATYMRSLGYPSEVIQVGVFHKVFLGPYVSEEDARKAQTAYGSGFLVLGSQMFDNPIYTIPEKKPAEIIEDSSDDTTVDTSEDTVEDTSGDTIEDTSEDTIEDTIEDTSNDTIEDTNEDTSEDTTDESTEDTDDESTEDQIDDTTNDMTEESNDDLEIIVEDDTNTLSDDYEPESYKMFTIVLIMILWLIFIFTVIVFRLNQSKKVN